MSTIAAKNSIFKLDKVSVLKDISAFLTAASVEALLEFSEDTAFGDNSKTKVVTLADSNGSLDYIYDSATDSAWDVFKSEYVRLRDGTVASLTFEYGPEGEVSGKPRFTGELLLTSFPTESTVDGIVIGSVGVEVTGDLTIDTFP